MCVLLVSACLKRVFNVSWIIAQFWKPATHLVILTLIPLMEPSMTITEHAHISWQLQRQDQKVFRLYNTMRGYLMKLPPSQTVSLLRFPTSLEYCLVRWGTIYTLYWIFQTYQIHMAYRFKLSKPGKFSLWLGVKPFHHLPCLVVSLSHELSLLPKLYSNMHGVAVATFRQLCIFIIQLFTLWNVVEHYWR